MERYGKGTSAVLKTKDIRVHKGKKVSEYDLKNSDSKLFNKWCKLVGKRKCTEEVTASELNSRLSSCFVTIRKM